MNNYFRLKDTDKSTNSLGPELTQRQQDADRPKCGSGKNTISYDIQSHVVALIIILILSTLACSFPIVARRFPRLPVPHHFLFLSRHFGTGVLIATAFVHLLPTAFVSLTDPCLPAFWNNGYPAMAGLIAMTSVLIVVGIEMFFATRGAGHIHASSYNTVPERESVETYSKPFRNGARNSSGSRLGRSSRALSPSSFRAVGESVGNASELANLAAGASRLSESMARGSYSPAIEPKERNSFDLDLDEVDPLADASVSLVSNSRNRSSRNAINHHRAEAGGSAVQLAEQQEQQKMLLQCLLLEAGILFHSVFIGMALSVATGTSFMVLLVAISFHQTFEGLALGSRIAAISSFPARSPKPWLMALAYGTTTPIGQAIGLIIHNFYDPASQTGLLMVGIMNAISSGLLLFAGLVELLAEDFLSDKSYSNLKGRKRLEASGAVVGGSMLMALVGAFA